ncbi:hypothetical protein CVIRNUC_009910 [Coccomyxa viridis]|uniref:Uncharacterized protein n=1 Tax=Coccomyxa viridis TaxID=1274662 RepID=A0AAV1IJ62_9CHLO|nr:hypothetical protein CVIRNUC_009910 [Coccomyxa viridis]
MMVNMQGIWGIASPSNTPCCRSVGRFVHRKISHRCAAPRTKILLAASALGRRPAGSQTALPGASALQSAAFKQTQSPERRGAGTIRCQTTEGNNYIDLPEPSRRSVALPRLLNSAGKMFTFAGILKILFVAHGAVPWAGISGWPAIATMVPFGLGKPSSQA